MPERFFWSGNIACAEAALRAGCKFYAGYPITPSSDLMEHMARELPKRGGVFFQAEDELAAINAAIGASIAGAKSMTATSGPGFSLMQEAIGYAVMVEVPVVIVDVMRVGPGTGQATKAAQGDVMQARWGRHGDQAVVVYAPWSPQEAFDLTIRAFNTAEELRVPVIVLTDELIAHSWETVVAPDEIKVIERRKPRSFHEPPFGSKDPRIAPPMPPLGEGYNLLYTGSTHNEWGVRKTIDPEVHYRLVKRIVDKVFLNVDKLFLCDEYFVDDADVLVISFGSASRSCLEAVRRLRDEGVNAGLLRLKTLWPLNDQYLRKVISRVNYIVVVEMNLGQLIYDVERYVKDQKIARLNKVGGGIPVYPHEVVKKVKEVLGK